MYSSFLKIAILCVLVCSCQSKADTIIINAKVITVDSTFSVHEAIAIKENKIIAVGTTKEILKLSGSESVIKDLKGKVVMPGIYEGHVHVIPASQSDYLSSLPDLTTINDLLNWILEESKTKKKGEWIIHPKFFATRLIEMRQPTLKELDSVAPNNPVFLNGSYGGMVNSKAFKVSKINQSDDYEGIVKNNDTGKFTGYIRRSAFKLLNLKETKENLSEEQKLDALQQMLTLYNKVGITSICSGSGNPEFLSLFKKLQASGKLTTRVFQNMYVPFNPHSSENEIRKALANFPYKTGDGDEWVKVGSLKVLLDGGILTGTAFLREPWGLKAKDIYGIDDPNYLGILNINKDELKIIIKVAQEFGWKFTAHVTGGGGVDVLLSAFEEVDSIMQINGKRHSIIHGNFYNPESISRMNELGIYAEVQAAWYYKDADIVNHVLGKNRIKYFQPYNSLLESNIILNGGSDHMVKYNSYKSINPYNPFLSMWVMIGRETEKGNTYHLEERISRKEAIKSFTINNAMMSFEEDIKGSLEIGKLADLIILSKDILTCPVDEIKNIEVEMTMLDGKIIYEQ